MTDKPWGGVFDQATDRRVEKFTESVSLDHRLSAHDIQGSVAHARMLAEVGILTTPECDQITSTLEDIGREIADGNFPFREDLEDVHMNIEHVLVERIGDVGRKLHTGRSRNDQVSTAFRLWIRDQIDSLESQLRNLQVAFLGRANQDEGVILPGYTHLRRAQPVLAAHYWLAYCEKFQRDRERLDDCRSRVNQLPLGTAALAGTSIPIDRQKVANELGFDSLLANSLDSSSDRDFAAEFVFCLTLVAEHLSTWAEEWIIWSTSEFGFLRLPQQFCTGSSIMPQKINPDVLELIRGKTARVIGNLTTLLVLQKGLPLAYNRDLQEDKRPVFDSADTVEACLELAAAIVTEAELDREAIAKTLDEGYLDATSLMEYMTKRGIPQRSAHHVVGRLVASAMAKRVPLAKLSLADFQAADPSLDKRVYDVLGADRAVAAFRSCGSTNPDEVQKQLAAWRVRLGLA